MYKLDLKEIVPGYFKSCNCSNCKDCERCSYDISGKHKVLQDIVEFRAINLFYYGEDCWRPDPRFGNLKEN